MTKNLNSAISGYVVDTTCLTFSVIIMIFPVRFVEGLNYIRSFEKLTHVPRDIPAAAIKIYLNNNVISNIKYGAFARDSHCLKLRLDQNRLTDIRKEMWTGLVALEWLSLEHNDIGSIHSSAFADLPNLKGLYLHNNKLTFLPRNIFPPKQMPAIQTLTLHQNSLKHDGLGWLRNLCDNGLIQEYTIRGDNVHCSHSNGSHVSDQPEYVTQGELTQGNKLLITDDVICVVNLGQKINLKNFFPSRLIR